MANTSRGVRTVVVIVAFALMLFSVGFSYAAVGDYARRDVMPRGSKVAGVDVSGLTRAQAISLLERKVREPLLQPVTAEARGKHFTLDPKAMVAVDVTAMVDRALAPHERSTFVQRVVSSVTNASTGISVPAEVSVDAKALKAWASTTSKAAYTKPTDAKLSVAGDSIRISKSETGWRVDEAAAVTALQQALTSATRRVQLPLDPVKPKVTEGSYARTLLVHLNQRRVRLFNGTKFVKSWPIAIGMPGHATPQGWWKVAAIEYNPSWTNPAPGGWGGGMPAYIPPGPGNPLGTLAVITTAPGVAFHGTQNDGSIGEAASHGCMRMHEWDVHDLAPRVKVGDNIIIMP